jgi:hypothetical protein
LKHFGEIDLQQLYMRADTLDKMATLVLFLLAEIITGGLAAIPALHNSLNLLNAMMKLSPKVLRMFTHIVFFFLSGRLHKRIESVVLAAAGIYWPSRLFGYYM